MATKTRARPKSAVRSNRSNRAGFFEAYYKFSRPHTIKGTSASAVVMTFIAIQQSSSTPFETFKSGDWIAGFLVLLISSLLMNVYIVGLNQLFDVSIDKINKPFLPLAAGDFSIATGWTLVVLHGVLSLQLAWLFGTSALVYTVCLSGLLGTAYSIDLPFFRWKRYPVMAGACIVIVRGIIVQAGFYTHIQQALGLTEPVFYQSRSLMFALVFFCIFGLVIALLKDAPDVKGDRKHNIKSFSVNYGTQSIVNLCVLLLAFDQVIAIGMSVTAPTFPNKVLTGVCHLGTLAVTIRKAMMVKADDHSELVRFYAYIWKLFYLEYILLLFVR